MPKTLVPIADLDQSVTRPVMLDIINQVLRETRIGSSTVILYPGADGQVYQPNSTVTSDRHYVENGDAGQTARLGNFSQVTTEVTEEYDQDRTLGTAVFQPENLFIFRDDALGVAIKPSYSYTSVTIAFKYRTQDQTDAEQWVNQMRQRVSNNYDMRLYDITYSYYLAPQYLYILKEIHRLRENVMGYGDTFEQYLKEHLSGHATQLTDSAGKNLRWAIAETQMRVQGGFDFDGAPEQATKEGNTATWQVSFALKFKYNKPTTQVMFWPIMVHQQVLAQKFRPAQTPYMVEHQARTYGLLDKSLSVFEASYPMYQSMLDEGYRMPNFDEFVPTQVLPGTKHVITLLLTLDMLQPQELFSLANMGEYVLDPDVQAFMLGEAPYMTKKGESVFHLALYQDVDMMQDGFLAVDAALNVTSTVVLDYRRVYHVRLSMQRNLCGLPRAAQLRFQKSCAAATKIIDALDGRIKYKPGLPVCTTENYLYSADLSKICTTLNAAILNGQSGINNGMNTVSSLFIAAKPPVSR